MSNRQGSGYMSPQTPVRGMAEVMAARKSPGGCCERHTDNKACDCILKAHIHDSKRQRSASTIAGPQGTVEGCPSQSSPSTQPPSTAPVLSPRESAPRVALFQSGDFTLASGAKSSWKLECDALSQEDWQGAAAMLVASGLVGQFGTVSGVPRGGLPFAKALEPYCSCVCGIGLDHHREEYAKFPGGGHKFTPIKRHLLVDDVLTTGGSLHKELYRLTAPPNGPVEVICAVLFARGPCPSYVKALLQLPECLWLKPNQS